MTSASSTPYDPAQSLAIDRAVKKICDALQQSLPLAGGEILEWMKQLAGGQEPAAYYHHLRGSPMFLFPWYLEKSLRAEPDPDLQFDLIYSTVNGYYWVRLIDNLMDGQATNETQLLPALGFFHTNFQRAYHERFDAAHPFWDFFSATWFHSADVTIGDARSTEIDRAKFVQVSAQKICAIKIPLAAICYTYSRSDLIEPWGSFLDLFGCWHQMCNDLFHWYEDFNAGTPSYFLAEAQRQKEETESVPDWVTREGVAWGVTILDGWMNELQSGSQALHSPDLTEYLHFRHTLLHNESDEMLEALRLASKLQSLFFESTS